MGTLTDLSLAQIAAESYVGPNADHHPSINSQ